MNQGDKGILKRWTYQQMKRRDELPALDHKLHQPSAKGFWHFPPTKGIQSRITITSSLVKPQGQDIADQLEDRSINLVLNENRLKYHPGY